MASDDNIFCFISDPGILGGANCVEVAALLTYETEEYLNATKRGTKGEVAVGKQKTVGGNHGYCMF